MRRCYDLTQFTGYDLAVAKCHIENWGVIYVDEYGLPFEVEDVMYMLGEL